ncbi:hypothetical protein COY26_02190 [Candidatus Woesearchaeota archaeon CG_4_10_14_0_2_um_filter_33_10]|nr:MAG: hypothetical protein AUJ83_01110 [Candidatus Woesearchaeota archaeon CG1_02_33_12]PIN78971.1 MAG: hypothetical protein COV14_01330 [Candidatus Woesearchaeota archaeon CG10_big_fil_rev_8_21_14_0_10_33_12]PIU72507.1 MAG: hypothetical protein COS79_02510 [Candidatus Woesearchaeota archaeon CG06_land_8_20_14_3_00_33_13]PIZ53346.1 MAG: hypothetical protein COY26_02190 [Candidatus Woesearchaeota archaeon CG_4_10_14_0_2_um_filter_33_10]
MDIGIKAKNLFNEISFGLLHLLETPNESKRDYKNNTMDPLPKVKPLLGIGGTRGPINMRDYAYHPGYVGSNDKGLI